MFNINGFFLIIFSYTAVSFLFSKFNITFDFNFGLHKSKIYKFFIFNYISSYPLC